MVKKESYSRMHKTKTEILLKGCLGDFCDFFFAAKKIYIYIKGALSTDIRCHARVKNKLYWKNSDLKALYHEV